MKLNDYENWLRYGYKVILIWLFVDIILLIISALLKNWFSFLSIILCGWIKVLISIIARMEKNKK